MSHHQSITQFHQQQDNRIILPLNLDLIDDDDDDDSDSDSDYEDGEIDSDYDYEDEIEVYDDEIDDIEEEELEEGEVTSDGVSSVSVLDLDDGLVVNGDGDEESLVSVSWCGGGGDGLICPICFEGWTSGGEHQMCCLPCGHIYGLSCINKWLQRFRGPGKCPQCKNLCTLKGVRVLYASRLCAADEELHERVRALEAKCADLEQKAAPLTPEELIDQICSNPALVQRLAAALAELNQQQAVS